MTSVSVRPVRLGADQGRMGSPQFNDLTARNDTVIAVQQRAGGPSSKMPTARTFDSFPTELTTFSSPIVLCNYFGDALGVFQKPQTEVSPSEKTLLADQIAGTSPQNVTCKVVNATR